MAVLFKTVTRDKTTILLSLELFTIVIVINVVIGGFNGFSGLEMSDYSQLSDCTVRLHCSITSLNLMLLQFSEKFMYIFLCPFNFSSKVLPVIPPRYKSLQFTCLRGITATIDDGITVQLNSRSD